MRAKSFVVVGLTGVVALFGLVVTAAPIPASGVASSNLERWLSTASATGSAGPVPARTAGSDLPENMQIPSRAKVIAVAGGLYHSLALSSTGTVFAWGWNIVGQLCDGRTTGSDVPVRVAIPADTRVAGMAAGFADSLVVTSTGLVFACGTNYNGTLGDGSTATSDVPVKVDLPAGTKVTAVAAGALHGLALTSTGAVLAWGYNADGELGNGSTANSHVPVKVRLPAGTKVAAIASGGPLTGVGVIIAGPGHSLAMTSTGAVFAWGYNADGELGDGGTANSDVPVKVKLPGGTRVTAIAAGELHSLAVTSTGSVLAWGGNNFGQLGDGSYIGSEVPVKVNLQGSGGGLMAAVRLAQPELAAMAPVTSTQSTVFAGYNFPNYIAVPGAVSATIVVPNLNCKATPAGGSSIYVGVGIQSVNSYARLYLGCTPQHVARYYPSLLVNGSTKNIAGDVAHPGDTIEFAVSQSVSKVTDSVIDMTHKFIATSNGAGSGTSEGILAGDFPVASGTTYSAPNFGTLRFSSALINGYPFGSAETGLQADNLSAGSTSPLQIKTTYSPSDKEAFATVFEHS
jgi:hypothetical protein